MKYILTLLITFLSFFCLETVAQENPFMQWSRQKYAEYSEDLYNASFKIDLYEDTIEGSKFVRQIEEVAHKTGSKEWQLWLQYFELKLYIKKSHLYGNTLYPAVEIEKKIFQLLKKTEKAKVVNLELLLRQLIINNYWGEQNYELAFELYAIQNERLKEISADDIPEKADYFIKLGNAYHEFKDDEKAIYYFNKVLEQKITTRAPNARQHARNGLGLIYRYAYNDLDRSDSYYYAIKQAAIDECTDKGEWIGIADSHLGYNMFLRGEYARAIPLLKKGLEKMLFYKDPGFATGPAINLAHTYLKTGDISAAKHYIDIARECYHKAPRCSMLPRIYEVMSKYYATIGNTKLSIAYMDSTMAENKKSEAQFNALQMMRVEQRQHLSAQKLKEEQLNAEKIKSNGYKRSFIIAMVALFLIGGVLAFYFVLYRKKKEAYLGLYHQIKEQDRLSEELEAMTKQYDQNMSEEMQGHADTFITSLPGNVQQRQLVSHLREYLMKDSYFATFDIDIQKLISEMNTSRGYFFKAIKEITGKTPMDFINHIRLDEAKKMLDSTNLTIETIALECGFNTVRTFYRQFRERYNITPTEYRNIAKDQAMQ